MESGAQLEFVSIQEWDRTAVHASNHRMNVEKDAKLKHIAITLGGDLVRICPDIELDKPGAEVELFGVYFTDTDQHQEHRLFVNHSAENCRSDVHYKGALQGQQAHAVWIGDVLIGKQAFNTDSYEQNRNLVLNEGAKADSVPNLELKTARLREPDTHRLPDALTRNNCSTCSLGVYLKILLAKWWCMGSSRK